MYLVSPLKEEVIKLLEDAILYINKSLQLYRPSLEVVSPKEQAKSRELDEWFINRCKAALESLQS